MLARFEDCVKAQYEALGERDKVHFCCKFNRKYSYVRCCKGFAILLSEQISCIQIISTLVDFKALKAIKATPREHRHEYQHQYGEANLPGDNFGRDSFFKVQRLAIICKLGRIASAELK